MTAALISLDLIQLWHLVALALLVAIGQSFGTTLNQTMLMDTVGRQRVFNANAIFGATFQFGIFVGPAIGGVLVARFGVEAAFYMTGVVLVLAALAASRIRAPQSGRGRPATTVMADVKEGFRYMFGVPVMRWLFFLSLSIVSVGMYFTLVPRIARDFLDAGADGYGSMLAAQGIGGLVGVVGLILTGNVRWYGAILVAAAVAFGLLNVGVAFSPSVAVAVGLSFFMGICAIWWTNTMRVALQTAASDQMRGRAMSVFTLAVQMAMLGWLVGGALSELIGPRYAIVTSASILGGLHVLAWLRSPDLRALGK